MPTRLVAFLAMALLAGPLPGVAAARLAAAQAPSTGHVAAAVPAGFRALSVTFASPHEGWVLGSIPCGATRCPAIAHTLDGGYSWARLPAPATSINPSPGLADGNPGVGSIRFSDARNGWAFGPELWSTRDGGHSWSRVHVPGFGSATILALEAAHGTTQAVFYDGQTQFRIASSAVASRTWTVSSLKLPVGAGPVPEIQLVLSGESGWVLQNDRTVVNGARLAGGAWHLWQPPCASVVGPAYLAASSPSNLVAVCDVGQWSTPAGERLYASRDGGLSFARRGAKLPTTAASEVASRSSRTIVVAGYLNGSLQLVGSFNGGGTWATVRSLGSVVVADLGFTTPFQGVVVTSAGRLYMSRNGGRAWVSVMF